MAGEEVTSSRNARRLLATIVVSSVIVLALAAAINYVIDPYDYFHAVTIPGLNASKPLTLYHDRIMKVGAVRRLSFDCILVGSSRVSEGLSSQDPSLRDCHGVYDVALAGASAHEMLKLADFATAVHHVKRVVLGLDFFTFNAYRQPERGFSETMFEPDFLSELRTTASLLFSGDTLLDSLETVAEQDEPTFFQPDGGADDAFLASQLTVRSTRATFLRCIRGYIYHNLPPPLYAFAARVPGHDPIAELQDFLVEQHRAGRDVLIFIPPGHVWQAQLLATLGQTANEDAWERAIVGANRRAAELTSSRPYPLWDFSGFGPLASEPVPKSDNSPQQLRYYWDCSHYRRTLGRIILKTMAQGHPSNPPFGASLDASDIGSHLADMHRVEAAWRTAYPDDVADIDDSVSCFGPPTLVKKLGLPPATAKRCFRQTTLTR